MRSPLIMFMVGAIVGYWLLPKLMGGMGGGKSS